MAVFFQKDLLPEMEKVSPQVMAQIIHGFMERVQEYTEQMLLQKWEVLTKEKGRDHSQLSKFSEWLTFHKFNEITLQEIENGDLDEWFQTLFQDMSRNSKKKPSS